MKLLALLLIGVATQSACADEIMTVLYAFTNRTDGGTPEPGMIQSTNGLLYGSTSNGGSNGWGGLFVMTTNGDLSPWHAFNYTPDGASPAAGVVRGSNGMFFGVTPLSGAYSTNQGSFFQTTAGGAFSTLYSFSGLSHLTNGTGGTPVGPLVQGTNGLFYGVTSALGPKTNGTVFSVSATGQFTLRYTFTNGSDGGKPLAGLFLSSNGNFYGSTSTGGSNGAGTIFRISHAGAFSAFHSFSVLQNNTNTEGTSPVAPFIQTPGGVLVGTASKGGANGSGTVFQITTNGAFNVIYTFSAKAPAFPNQNNDGATPGTVLLNSAGNYWGVATYGGTNGEGAVFEVTPQGAFRSVYAFLALSFTTPATNSDGANPNGIIESKDGSYYCTTGHGGNGYGTVVKFTPYTPPIQAWFAGDIYNDIYSNGQFHVLLNDVPTTATVVVEASDDLVVWTPILTNGPGPTQRTIIDTNAGSHAARFYRAIINP